jgi:hypothetical protein
MGGLLGLGDHAAEAARIILVRNCAFSTSAGSLMAVALARSSLFFVRRKPAEVQHALNI